MNTERGSFSVEGILVVSLALLISAMAVETRCIFRESNTTQRSARNAAVGTASLDGSALKLLRIERETSLRPFRVMKPLLEAVGLDAVKTRYVVFSGTETGNTGRTS